MLKRHEVPYVVRAEGRDQVLRLTPEDIPMLVTAEERQRVDTDDCLSGK